MISGMQSHLDMAVVADAADAISQGYHYRLPEYRPIMISKVVVVKNGTISGKSTVDLVLEDDAGQKHVVMVTGALIKALADQC